MAAVTLVARGEPATADEMEPAEATSAGPGAPLATADAEPA